MITKDNTERALQALRSQSKAHFHEDLNEYLIEVLESIDESPNESHAILLKQEVRHIFSKGISYGRMLKEVDECIDDFFEVSTKIEPVMIEPIPDSGTSAIKLNIITTVIFIAASIVLYKVW